VVEQRALGEVVVVVPQVEALEDLAAEAEALAAAERVGVGNALHQS